MAKTKGGAEFKLIEKIFDQLSSSVAIALLKDDKLAYEFYGGRKATLVGNNESSAKAAGKGGFFRNTAKLADAAINRTTRFNIGTASSLFTGSLVIKLMEFDEIRLNDLARRFIPEFPFEDVSIYHLLTHTSGLASESVPMPDNQAAKREFYRKLFGDMKRVCAPGVRYDNYQYNYSILAYIAEKISGQTLEELASVLLFIPIGMKYTAFGGVSLKDNQYVVPWNHTENRFMNEMHAKQPMGHNGVYTTALDLLRFGRVFLNNGEFEGKTVFLESSVEFLLREITGGKFMRTPLFMIKRKVDVFGCFSEKLSPEAVALTGNTGSIIFIDPARRIVGTALTNSTWVDAVSQNYSNIIDILMTI